MKETRDTDIAAMLVAAGFKLIDTIKKQDEQTGKESVFFIFEDPGTITGILEKYYKDPEFKLNPRKVLTARKDLIERIKSYERIKQVSNYRNIPEGIGQVQTPTAFGFQVSRRWSGTL